MSITDALERIRCGRSDEVPPWVVCVLKENGYAAFSNGGWRVTQKGSELLKRLVWRRAE